eukprot:388592_1
MSLPKPSFPKPSKHTQRSPPTMNGTHQQFHRHLPSPIKPHFHSKSKHTKQKHPLLYKPMNKREHEEKKQHQNHTNHRTNHTYTHPDIYPKIFDPQFNTKHINWNELHYIALDKGRIIFIQHIIKQYYASYLTNYTATNNKRNLPNIPHLSCKILRFIQQILHETSIVQHAHTLLHTHDNWETQVDNYDNISVYYRKEEGSKNEIHSIKISFTSKCHPVDFIAVINEFDLIQEIVTIVPLETKYLKEWTHLNKVIYGKVFMWWPFKNRDAVVHIRAYDLLGEHDEVLICGKSSEDIKDITVPIMDEKTMRVDIRMGQGVIRPTLMDNGDVGTQVIAMLNVDFKTSLPKTLVNWITRTFAYYVCKMIRDRTENLEGTTHQQRVKEKR